MKTLWIAVVLLAIPQWAMAQQSAPSMPGMNMQMPQQSTTQNTTGESQSLRNSEQQQRLQHVGTPGRENDAQSVSHATMALQEPENPGYHTGHDLPAPELLHDVAKRTPLSVEDFLAMAQAGNPTLEQARAYVRRSEEQGRQAGLWPNPSIGYSGEHIRGGEYGGGEQGAYLQQEIVLGGKLGLRRNIYRQEAKANQIGVDEQSYRVRGTVQQAFYRALSAQALVVVRQRLMKVAEDAASTAHLLANVGQADAPDVLQAEVEAEQAKVDFVRAQREFLGNFHALVAVAGAPGLEVSPLKGELEPAPQIDPEQQIAAIQAQSPTVQRAQQEVAVAEARLKDARREAVPDVTLRAGEWWSGEVMESSHQAAGPMSFVDAGVKLPLWNRNQGNVEAAKADLERAKQDVTRTQLFLKQEAEPLAQEYLAAQFEANRYRDELLPRARRAYELYLMKYQQMAAAYPQVLVSQRTLFQLQVAYLNALEVEWRNALALDNFTLTGGLAPSMGSSEGAAMINLPNGGGA